MSDTKAFPLINATIERGHDKIGVQVPEHEIDVLKAVHGPTNVIEGDPADDEIELSTSADDEYQRLQRKYKRINGPDPVGIAYKTGPAGLKEHGFDLSRGTREAAPQAGVRNHKKPKAKADEKPKAKA